MGGVHRLAKGWTSTYIYIERQDVVHQLVLARESSTAPVPAPECGWPDERVSGRVWQILEC